MDLKLHNTLTRKKEVFTPLDSKNVRMYVCGPTVYDFAHIGNARPVIVFDVLFRLLRHLYGAEHVTYVRNITDVDDKINARAADEFPGLPLNEAIARVTSETTKQFHEDIKALGVLEPTVEPACTDHIKQMIAMIDVLESKGYAYQAEGHMLLDTAQIPNYGQLSGRSLDEMIAGARVEVAPYKRNPADSVLWKPSTDEQPGWDSPWGRGRPGWHIECSAMSKEYLGEVFDIHGGGIDLTFPHHENELAQSTCVHDTKQMAQVWMHNGYLQVEGRKMSKSEGNFVTINELLTGWQGVRWPGAVLRLAMLSTHYRQPIDWTKERLEQAATTLMYIRSFVFPGGITDDDSSTSPSEAVLEALSDDLNTPKALAEIHQLLDQCKRNPVQSAGGPREVLRATCRFLGLNVENVTAQAMFTQQMEIDKGAVGELITARNTARAAKDWVEADRIRDELDDMGVVLKDGSDGTTWEIKR